MNLENTKNFIERVKLLLKSDSVTSELTDIYGSFTIRCRNFSDKQLFSLFFTIEEGYKFKVCAARLGELEIRFSRFKKEQYACSEPCYRAGELVFNLQTGKPVIIDKICDPVLYLDGIVPFYHCLPTRKDLTIDGRFSSYSSGDYLPEPLLSYVIRNSKNEKE